MSSPVELRRLEGKRKGFEVASISGILADLCSHALMLGKGHARAWIHVSGDPLDHGGLVVVSGATGDGSRLIGPRSLGRLFDGAAAEIATSSRSLRREAFFEAS